jgi:hypothetical protein
MTFGESLAERDRRVRAQALREAADIAEQLPGPDAIGLARWSDCARHAYLTAVEEIAEAIRARADAEGCGTQSSKQNMVEGVTND